MIEHVHPEDRPRVLKRLELPWPEDHQTYEYRFQTQDGADRWMHDAVRLVRDADGNPVEMAGVDGHYDRKQAEEALTETESQYRLLVKLNPRRGL